MDMPRPNRMKDLTADLAAARAINPFSVAEIPLHVAARMALYKAINFERQCWDCQDRERDRLEEALGREYHELFRGFDKGRDLQIKTLEAEIIRLQASTGPLKKY